MSDRKEIVLFRGPGLCTLVFVTFLVLKLTEVINWSWWYITMPLWGPAALLIAVLLTIFIIVVISSIIIEVKGNRK